jgi:hypothetical protein
MQPTKGEWVLAVVARKRLGVDPPTWTRRFAPLVRSMGSDGATLTPTRLYYWPDCQAVGVIWERKRQHLEAGGL